MLLGYLLDGPFTAIAFAPFVHANDDRSGEAALPVVL
jgi:hypothetical protein